MELTQQRHPPAATADAFGLWMMISDARSEDVWVPWRPRLSTLIIDIRDCVPMISTVLLFASLVVIHHCFPFPAFLFHVD